MKFLRTKRTRWLTMIAATFLIMVVAPFALMPSDAAFVFVKTFCCLCCTMLALALIVCMLTRWIEAGE